MLSTLSGAQAREITDMAGRTVDIPDSPTCVYTPAPPGGILLYTMDPGIVCGINFFGLEGKSGGLVGGDERAKTENVQTVNQDRAKSAVSGAGGQSRIVSPEALLRLNPDLVMLFPKSREAAQNKSSDMQTTAIIERLGLTYFYAFAGDLRDYPAVYEFLGEVLQKQERARELADYINNTLKDVSAVVAQIPPEQRPKVYYANGINGLTTVNQDTSHGIIMKLAGDVGVHKTTNAMASVAGSEHENISFEQVMAYDPDVIIVQNQLFYNAVMDNALWQNLRAVQNGRVLWIPRGPLNWVDGPPSFMGALGLKWLMAELYPNYYPVDIVAEALDFYRLFLGQELSPAQMEKLIYPNGRN